MIKNKGKIVIRKNDQIRSREVRLIDQDGNQLGVVTLIEAKELAANAGLDLVEVSPDARPVVCKILDYGKHKYEKEKRDKEAKKKQKNVAMKEIKIKPRIDSHDLQVKVNRTKAFLEKGHQVKFTLTLFGRELAHKELGIKRLSEIVKQFEDIATIEKRLHDSRNFKMIFLSPKAAKK